MHWDGDKCQDGVWAFGSISRLRNWHGGAQVKLWDVSSEQPSLVAASDMGVGAIFSAAFCAESPFLVAAGGAKVSYGFWHPPDGCRGFVGLHADCPVCPEQSLLAMHLFKCIAAREPGCHSEDAGSCLQGSVAVWDTLSTAAVAAKYGRRHRPRSTAAAED